MYPVQHETLATSEVRSSWLSCVPESKLEQPNDRWESSQMTHMYTKKINQNLNHNLLQKEHYRKYMCV